MCSEKSRVLVVEDEPSIGQGLCDVLVFRGYEVSWETDGQKGLRAAIDDKPDLMLLDLMLPSLDGYSICRSVRESGMACGVIMLTAKGAEKDVLLGFECGADDYVTKPFSVSQLLARVEAVLGRSRGPKTDFLTRAGVTVRFDRAVLEGPSGSVELSAKELIILRLLLDEPGRIVARRTLLKRAWEMANVDGVETRTVDVHMAKLRKKLAETGKATIVAVRSQGYRFVAGEDRD